MTEVELMCTLCGEYSTVETEAPELNEVYTVCPHCGAEDNHPITDII